MNWLRHSRLQNYNEMKNLFFALLILTTSFLQSQAPQAFNYQGAARDADGLILANKTISLRISIKNGSITGANVYIETHNVTTSELGLFAIAIGTGTIETGEFSNIDWGGGSKFLNVAMDIDGGSNFIDMGTSQLLSTPYALYAETAGNGGGGGFFPSKNNAYSTSIQAVGAKEK